MKTELQQLLEQVSRLSDEDKMQVLDACYKENQHVLDYRIITKEIILDEIIFRLENSLFEERDNDVTDWLLEENSDLQENVYDKEVFEAIYNNCNQNLFYDYSEWNERDEDILNYIYFEQDDFVSDIRTLMRDKKLSLLGI